MNFPSQIFFEHINHGYSSAILNREIICSCFHFVWLWLLISIMKRCAERCALQFYQTSLKLRIFHNFESPRDLQETPESSNTFV